MAVRKDSSQQTKEKFLENLGRALIIRGASSEQVKSVTDQYSSRGIWSAVDIDGLQHKNLQFMTLAFYLVMRYDLQTSEMIQTFFRPSSGMLQIVYEELDKTFGLAGKDQNFIMLNIQTLLSYCELTLPTSRNIL